MNKYQGVNIKIKCLHIQTYGVLKKVTISIVFSPFFSYFFPLLAFNGIFWHYKSYKWILFERNMTVCK